MDPRTGVWNITAELPLVAGQIPNDSTAAILDELSDFSAILTVSDLRRAELIISVPASDIAQAVSTARALLLRFEPVRLVIESAADFDRRSELEKAGRVPPLVSASQAAERLSISRTAVVKRCNTGALPGVKVGEIGWVIPEAAVVMPDQG